MKIKFICLALTVFFLAFTSCGGSEKKEDSTKTESTDHVHEHAHGDTVHTHGHEHDGDTTLHAH